MRIGEAAFERAAELAARERDAGVARIQARLAGSSGRLVCDCGDEISEARRRAVPHTDKCVNCAMRMERLRRRA